MVVSRHNPDLDAIFAPDASGTAASVVATPPMLPFFDAASKALELASTVDEVKEIRDRVEALRAYAHQARASLLMQNRLAEIRLRAERRLGEMLGAELEHEGGRPKKQSHDATVLPATLEEMGITKSQSSRWQTIARIPTRSFESYLAGVRSGRDEELTTAGLLRATLRLNTVAAMGSSESYEWFTPARYVEAVRQVLGEIDLDPASCTEANRVVRAKMFYALEDDGLSKLWLGRVWLNPPYGLSHDGRSNQSLWAHVLRDRFEAGDVSEAILLVNAATDASWFQLLWRYALCFVDHRIRFETPGGRGQQPTHGNVFAYFGAKAPAFAARFQQFGRIVIPLATLSTVLPRSA